MRYAIYIFISILYVLALACSFTPDKKEKVVLKKYNDNHVLIKEQEYVQNGNSLVADGYCKKFYDNGTLHILTYYKNNKENGFKYEYYHNGNLASKTHQFDDSIMGHSYLYTETGKLEAFFWCISPEDKAHYLMQYDTTTANGYMISGVGSPLIVNILNKKPYYSAQDTVKFSCVFPKPQRIKDTLFFSFDKNDDESVDTVLSYKYLDQTDMYCSEAFYPCSLGSTRCSFRLNLYDSATNHLRVLKVNSFDIIVK